METDEVDIALIKFNDIRWHVLLNRPGEVNKILNSMQMKCRWRSSNCKRDNIIRQT